MNFVANFIRFPAVKKFENRLRFDKVEKIEVEYEVTDVLSISTTIFDLGWP